MLESKYNTLIHLENQQIVCYNLYGRKSLYYLNS